MSEISETEIKTMTKEQNYIRGYKDGKSDVLDKIRAEIEALGTWRDKLLIETVDIRLVLDIVDKYKAESEEG